MSDPSLLSALALVIETTINKALKYDPGTCVAIQALDQTCLKINCTQPEINLYIIVDNDFVKVQAFLDETLITPDITLQGSATDLIQLGGGDNHSLANSGVNVSGKAQLLVSIQDIFQHIDIDWEEAISEKLGVLTGHQLANFIRHAGGWLNSQKIRFEDECADYLTDELRVIPSASELQRFHTDISSIKSRLDRLIARTNLIKQKIHDKKTF